MAKSSSFDKDTNQILNQLKKQLKRKTPPLKTETKVIAPAPVLDDEALFKQALQGVTPLPQDNNTSLLANFRKPKIMDAETLARRAAAEGTEESQHHEISDTQALLNPVSSDAFLSYRIATLQHRIFDQLKTGKLRWFEAVDLHGCSIEQARAAVLKLIDIAHQENQTVVKIVHGKGPTAILKTCVNGWLRQHRDVLGFVSAPPEQGGTGAVLVLLKRPLKEPANQLGSAKPPNGLGR